MIDLGTGVLDMRYENPLALAENIASADLISEGRVAARRELGIAGGRHRRAGRLRNGQAARGARRVRRISGEAAAPGSGRAGRWPRDTGRREGGLGSDDRGSTGARRRTVGGGRRQVPFALPSQLGVAYITHLFENLVAQARDLGWT